MHAVMMRHANLNLLLYAALQAQYAALQVSCLWAPAIAVISGIEQALWPADTLLSAS